MVPEEITDLNLSSGSVEGSKNNGASNLKYDQIELEPRPIVSQEKEYMDEKPGHGECDAVNMEDHHDMELEKDLVEKPLILPENVKLEESVVTAKQTGSDINNPEIDYTPISGVKRSRIEYDDREPSVRVIYNSLTSASKRKLEELLQQWSEWNAQPDSQIKKPHEALVSGEETYFPALHVGTGKSPTVSFWMDGQTKKDKAKEIERFDGDSAPLYDREYSMGLTSVDGSANAVRGLEREASRCFNCTSYSHSMKDCPKPRDNVAINNARKQHSSKRGQSTGSHKQTRYYQNSCGGKYDGLRPGFLGPETRQLLGIGEFDPPPWLHRMREIGYPPGYLDADDEDQASGIKIYMDDETMVEKIKDEQDDRELPDINKPVREPKKKMTVEFPGINVPIPDNADEKRWASFQNPVFDPYRNRLDANSNHFPEAINGGYNSDQRRLGNYRDDIHLGCKTIDGEYTHTSGSPYIGHNSNFALNTHSPRGNIIQRNPILGRSLSDRGRMTPWAYDGSPNQSTSPYLNPAIRHSPQSYSSSSSTSATWSGSSYPDLRSELSLQRHNVHSWYHQHHMRR